MEKEEHDMMVKKALVCLLVFAVLLVGAGLLEQKQRELRYAEWQTPPPEDAEIVRATHVQNDAYWTEPFAPREYVRIVPIRKEP